MPRTPNRGPQGGIASEGRINIYPSQAADPSSPTPVNGDIYFNTVIREWLYFDDARSSWLTITSYSVTAGRNGNVTAGTFFRGINGMLLNAGDKGFSVPLGTIIGMGISKESAAVSDIEVLVNGAVVSTFTTGGSGNTSSFLLDVDFASGLMSFRNASTGATVRNSQITLWYKRRV